MRQSSSRRAPNSPGPGPGSAQGSPFRGRTPEGDARTAGLYSIRVLGHERSQIQRYRVQRQDAGRLVAGEPAELASSPLLQTMSLQGPRARAGQPGMRTSVFRGNRQNDRRAAASCNCRGCKLWRLPSGQASAQDARLNRNLGWMPAGRSAVPTPSGVPACSDKGRNGNPGAVLPMRHYQISLRTPMRWKRGAPHRRSPSARAR